MAANRTILLRTSESGLFDEKVAGTTGIKPGMNVALQSDNTVDPGAAAGGVHRIARESVYAGGTVDTEYANGDTVFLYQPVPGDRLNLLLTDEQNITRGGGLKFAATGKLVTDGGTGTEYEAEETLNLTGAAGDALIACRKL
jgi:hypothetical protein